MAAKNNPYASLLKHEEINTPPRVIVVQGSSESGKTTLIKSLVYHYTKQKVNEIKGTITIRTNKNNRITFIECPNDINGMIDCAKICDLALLVIDASIGFEMETFEFLSILKNHGMPSTMGVLTHLDYFKDNKELRKTKKRMKMRFWKDVYDGAKLFYLSGVVFDRYPKVEVHNLARFISVSKYQELSWRTKHSYVVADRFDVIHNAETHLDKSLVSFYGYVRGTYLEENSKLHLMGIGDYPIKSATRIQDPVPVESRKPAHMSKEEFENEQGKKKRRTLKDKERIVYAPFSSLGALNFDKTSGYITIPDKYVVFSKTEDTNNIVAGNEGQRMVRELQDRKFRAQQRGGDDAQMDGLELVGGVTYDDHDDKKTELTKETNKIRVIQK